MRRTSIDVNVPSSQGRSVICFEHCRSRSSLMRNRAPLGPSVGPCLGPCSGSRGGGGGLMSEKRMHNVQFRVEFVVSHLTPHSSSTTKTKRRVSNFCLVTLREINQAMSLFVRRFYVHQPQYHSLKRPHENC